MAVVEANVFYLLEVLECLQCLECLKRLDRLKVPKCLKGFKRIEDIGRLEGLQRLQSLQRISRLERFMRLESLEGLCSMECREGVDVFERIERQYWVFGCLFRFLSLIKPRNTKIGLEKRHTFFLLLTFRISIYPGGIYI